ncbi:MAG TPA: hypothetical protein PLP17_00170 [Oligoflexia bacterium]|nr:hypothetical protein [Oligoflexia bacterium]
MMYPASHVPASGKDEFFSHPRVPLLHLNYSPRFLLFLCPSGKTKDAAALPYAAAGRMRCSTA